MRLGKGVLFDELPEPVEDELHGPEDGGVAGGPVRQVDCGVDVVDEEADHRPEERDDGDGEQGLVIVAAAEGLRVHHNRGLPVRVVEASQRLD